MKVFTNSLDERSTNSHLLRMNFLSYSFIMLVQPFFILGAYSQSSSAHCEFRFGQKTEGEITLSELLSDSLLFDCSESNDIFRLEGFSLTTLCDGVTRYWTNERNGLLTNDMKADARKMKPG